MNEQFIKIAEQAGFALWGKEEWNPGDVIDWSARYDKELEKFAELIVRECVGILETRNQQTVIINAVKEIKENFGVDP